MKRSNNISELNHSNITSYKQRVAYHEAGHAAAIHFNNRANNLPSVFFKIILDDLNSSIANSGISGQVDAHGSVARIKGGRLILLLPFECNEIDPKSSARMDAMAFRFTDGYPPAFEADIVNLLIGPLTEAKYIALRDDEPFHPQLLTVQALKHYGGEADLAVVYDYLQCYSADKQVQDKSLQHFFRLAFEFVNEASNWKAITRLAEYILASHSSEICCEEAAAVLDRRKMDISMAQDMGQASS